MPLVLTRKENETFYIGDDIAVTIISASSGRARIEIDAPREIDVWRSELPKKKSDDT